MRVQHPVALADTGIVDDAVDVNGELVAIDDDGTFELPDSPGANGWLDQWAAGYGYDAEDLIVEDADDDGDEQPTETCDAVKNDGEVCGRELPCPYHSTED